MCISKIATILIIIVIVILVVFLLHSFSIRNSKGNGGRVIVRGTYTITVNDKTKDNNFYGIGSSKCFYLNGIEAPTLKLERNAYYEFINESEEPFYFTTDEAGGPNGPGSLAKNIENGFQGHSNGTIYFKITSDLPDTFYYQSAKHKYMGSLIKIVF